MEGNTESFHVPQQNRRSRLRVGTETNQEQLPVQATLQTPFLNPDIPGLLSSQQTYVHSSTLTLSPKTTQTATDFAHNNHGLSLSVSYHLLNQQKIHDISMLGGFVKQNGEVRSFPLGPFTGYASILKNSRFLKPTQQTLDDFCSIAFGALQCTLESLDAGTGNDPITFSHLDRQRPKNSLTLLLEEVCRRYKLYHQQMQSVVASFKNVPGLGNATPYISFVIKAIAKQFSSLKNAIMHQIQFKGKTVDAGSISNYIIPTLRAAEQGLNVQNLTIVQYPIWRSQRGLPDHAVALLKTWMFEHFLHPYPTDSEKQMLAEQTGLSRAQVSNWFINARVRLWKPMVKEMHMIETLQSQMPSTNKPSPENFANVIPTQKAQDIKPKRARNSIEKNSSYTNLPSLGVGESGNFSLALCLHQNMETLNNSHETCN